MSAPRPARLFLRVQGAQKSRRSAPEQGRIAVPRGLDRQFRRGQGRWGALRRRPRKGRSGRPLACAHTIHATGEVDEQAALRPLLPARAH